MRGACCDPISVIAIVALYVASACGIAQDEEPYVPGERLVQATAHGLTFADHVEICEDDPRVIAGLVSLDVCVGADLFFRETFDGNGRACASCHPVANNFTLDAEFIAGLPASDPLFIAEQDPALAQLELPDLLRGFGLILENVDGFENPTQKFVMRSVPHNLSLAVSVTPQAVPTDGTTLPPLERTGWSGDGAPNQGLLRDFQTGAIIQHYTRRLARVPGTDFRLATDDELDAIELFLRGLGRLNDLDLAAVVLTDAGAEAGRGVFTSAAARCNGCHGNAGANLAGTNRNFNTGVERLRLAAVVGRAQNDGGFGGQGLANFNFDTEPPGVPGNGILDSFGNGTFNTPPLIEAADTPPFFHTNHAATLEDAIAFYNTAAFNQSPAAAFGTINLTQTQINQISRFLRVLNAAFNAQIAIKRLDAALVLVNQFANGHLAIQRETLRLAMEEVDDAIEVINGAPGGVVSPPASGLLTSARSALIGAIAAPTPAGRKQLATTARTQTQNAKNQFGAGLNFTIGAATIMF